MTVPEAAAWIARAVRDADVDPFVHAAPPPAERARHRPRYRPDQPAGRRGDRRSGLCGADAPGQRGARGLEGVDLARLGAVLSRELRKVGELLLPRAGEIVPCSHELVPHVPCLVRPRVDDGGLALDGRAELLRLRAGGPDLQLRVRDLVCDALVLHADVDQIRNLVERLLRFREPRKMSSVDAGSDS